MSTPDETLRIETPENVAFGYEIAGIGSRFLAALVDTTLIVILEGIVALTMALMLNNLDGGKFLNNSRSVAWLAAAGGLLTFAFFWGYYIFFEMLWNGQSPGKRLAGLRVIRVDGMPENLSESTIRNLVRIVDFLPAYYGIGVITMFINDQSRRLGDLAAGTLVVHDRGPVSLTSLEETKPPLPSAASLELDWPVDRLSPADLQLAEEFLRRRDELFNRVELSQQIARSLFDKMGLSDQPLAWPETEKYIRQIVEVSQNRRH